MGYMGYLPEWENTHYDFHALYAERLDQLFTKGYGIFAKYTAFMLKDHVIEPVLTPDPQRLSQLPAYETQRKRSLTTHLLSSRASLRQTACFTAMRALANPPL